MALGLVRLNRVTAHRARLLVHSSGPFQSVQPLTSLGLEQGEGIRNSRPFTRFPEAFGREANRFALYIRTSTSDQDGAAQLHALRRAAEAWRPGRRR